MAHFDFLRYVPQVYLNYKRQSTQGWSVKGVLLDFIGGLFSMSQLFLDSLISEDWSGLIGDPVKLLLGGLSVAFDIIFIYQHYILYKQKPYSSLDRASCEELQL